MPTPTREGMKQIGGFNVSTETAQAFKDFCAEHGGSYPQGFTILMELAKQEDVKTKLSDRGACIEEFKLTIQKLLELYTQSLELSADAEVRASEKVALQIQTQAEDIKAARDKISALTAELELEKEEKAAHLKEVQRLNSELDKTKDKQQIIDMLTSKTETLEAENKAAKEALDKLDQLETEYNAQISQLTAQTSDLKQKLTETTSDMVVARKDAEIAEKQLTELKKDKAELQSKLDQEREIAQARYDKLQAKMETALETEREKREKLQEQLIKLQMQLSSAKSEENEPEEKKSSTSARKK